MLGSVYDSSALAGAMALLPSSSASSRRREAAVTGDAALTQRRRGDGEAKAFLGHNPDHDGSYYAKCMLGGILSCGLTHTAIVPLDIVKCRMQVSPWTQSLFVSLW